MKYRDLIQFEAVTEVIQLVSANEKSVAAQLIDTYVISDRMADVILHRILPALKLGENEKSRGLFIVGNYGTGKSHLMSVITSIAEHADLLSHIKYPAVRAELVSIAGKFKVSRQETTALDVPLRDIVFSQLEADLKKMGVDYHFPGNKDAITNKQALVEMMANFGQIYPGQGLLIALDELLDFLRAKNEKEMIMDLNFLREVGEVCEVVPLRFMAGIQEALFDNPRFQFVADSIQRVKSRFDQASIVREDIAFVVTHRLLTKTEQQKKIIRKHLEKFTPLYAEMAERLDDFEDMFPVHPAYLEVFEQVTIGERRDLLKALSQEMEKLLDKEVPSDQPGLITFDSYWRMISEDNAFRALPDVRNVLDKTQVLAEKVLRAPETKDFRDSALRIIDGLALHRLTVSDIYAPIGITAAELRDRLCIHLPLPEQDADFLLATIETIMKAISTAVNGQFISHNRENDQYYLDLKKDIDYEALIQQKADALDPSTIDRYYFDILVSALEIKGGSYVPGFRIWESEIPWAGHGITRKGYIFLGASNERSTAHPERDYYIHFFGIYGNGHESLKPRLDEVYYKLSAEEKAFLEPLRIYAGAAEMSAISAGSNKDQYELKVRQTRTILMQWLRENFIRCFKVQHLESYLSIPEAIAKAHVTLRELNFRDQVYHLSGAMLNEAFIAKSPNYPSFEGIEITSNTLWEAAEAALKAISGGSNTRLAQIVLEGLELGHFSDGRMNWTIETSTYAIYFQNLVSVLNPGKVINRTDLVAGEPGAERDRKFNLEPELLLVILAALMRQGSLSIAMQGLQLAESDLSNAIRLNLDQLLRFNSISKPKPIPEQVVKELFSQFGLDPEIMGDPHALSLGITQLQQNIQNELNGVVRMSENLRDGPKFFGEMILSKAEQQKARKDLEDYRNFLSGLQSINTVARLANLQVGIGEIRASMKTRKTIAEIQSILDILRELDSVWEYLLAAEPLLPAKDAWQVELKNAKEYVLSTLSDEAKRNAQNVGGQLRGRLENVQTSYTERYLALHKEYRLDRDQDEQKRQLTADPRWARMRALSKLSLLPSKQLMDLQDKLGAVETCPNLQPAELKVHAHCPHCGFNPIAVQDVHETASIRLGKVREEFEALCKNWVDVLLTDLQSEQALHNIQAVDPGERAAVQDFLSTLKLPEPLNQRFIDGVENTLQGLEVLTIDGADYLLALTRPGMPCSADELEKRIREFLQNHLEGKDRRKIRIQINW
jgi:hypothetical protein